MKMIWANRLTSLLVCGVPGAALASGFPHTTERLSQARYYLSATTVANRAFFAGGAAASGYSAVVDIYDADTGLWSTDTLSEGRYYLTATTVGNKAMFAGGFTGPPGAVPSNVVDIYDADAPEGSRWSTHTLSQARGIVAATTVGNRAIFAGGYIDSTEGYSDVVDIYDAEAPDGSRWSTHTLSEARCYIAATTVGNKAVFGGGSNDSAVVDIYDDDTGLWSADSLSQGRSYLAATTAGNLALFAGGLIGADTYSDVVDIYDEDTGLWSTDTLSEARSALSGTTADTVAMFAGGLVGADTYSDVVDIYDEDTGLWSTDTLSQGRCHLSATAVGDTAFFGGGATGPTPGPGNYSDIVDIYTIPEPAALSLLVLGGLAVLRRRPRRRTGR